MLNPETVFVVVENNDLDVEKITRGFERLRIPDPVVTAADCYAALEKLKGTSGEG